jgi:phosphatidylserine/phosphatidylglycerophosphate/cardiolipin synthase-like enzyme
MSVTAASIPPAKHGSYPVRKGCTVHPLVDGHESFGRIAQAVEAARHSVWVTVAFIEREFRFPDGRGSLLDLLDAAARRGLDARVLFWRDPKVEDLVSDSQIFSGSPAEWAALAEREFAGKIRWDALPGFCHHQKSWLIDAYRASETAFVGGINFDRGSLSLRGHPAKPGEVANPSSLYREIHDLYSEIRGPATSDVAHNFVQRWNEASERNRPDGCFPDRETADDLAWPCELSPVVGDTPVQISRTIMPGVYTNTRAAPKAAPYAIEEGEESVREQVLAAIAGARESIYIENQIFLSKALLGGIDEALERGVRVIAVVPTIPMPELAEYRRRDPKMAAGIFDLLSRVGRRERFTLVGLAQRDNAGNFFNVYVHAKIMLVDDAWATIGSTNFVGRSFKKETEMNASFWSAKVVRDLREKLFDEHLAGTAKSLMPPAAFDHFAATARANRERLAKGQDLVGLAHALNPDTYCS